MSEVNYLWDTVEDNIVEEFDDAGNTIVDYTTEPELFGNTISQRRDGQCRFFHFDALGSTLAMTDDSQQVTDSRAYSAFGESTEAEGSTLFAAQFIGRQGYYRDVITGDYSVRRRSYVSTLSRFRSFDVLIETPTYAYVGNVPTARIDPSGMFACVARVCCVDDISLITKPADAPKGVAFSNPKGADYDQNVIGPYFDGKKGKVHNVHWIVVTGKHLEDCEFNRYFAATWKLNGNDLKAASRPAVTNADFKPPGTGVEPKPANIDTSGTGIRSTEFFPRQTEWAGASMIVIADAPGTGGDLSLKDFDSISLKWNYLVEVRSKTVAKGAGRANVAALIQYDVIIEGTVIEGTFQPSGAATQAVNQAVLAGNGRLRVAEYLEKYCPKEEA